jgi:hypothetical protein
MHRSTYVNRLRIALSRFPDGAPGGEDIEMPEFPSEDISAEEILDHMEQRVNKEIKYKSSIKNFPIKVKNNDPMLLAFVGDPHIGPHCNIQLLRRDVGLLRDTPGAYAVNLGDTTDNWGGRLMYLWAEADISKKTERKLAAWFLKESGVRWLVWLFGNHDSMAPEMDVYLRAVNGHRVPLMDWGAQFRVVFANKSEVKISAAHNHKGSSIYHRLHGQKRAAIWSGGDADIYVAGHHHDFGLEIAALDNGRTVFLSRASGYKHVDEYATRHQFPLHQYGSTIAYVLDPVEEAPLKRIHGFLDLEEAVEFLAWKRKKREC